MPTIHNSKNFRFLTVEKMGQKTSQDILQKISIFEHEYNMHQHEKKEKGSTDKYMREIINNIPAPIYLKDYQGCYLMINMEYEELAHVTLADIVGKNDFDIFPQPVAELFRSQDKEVIRKGIPCEFEETIPLADGIHTYITLKFPLRGKDGTIKAVGGFCTDITERKQAEEELNKYSNRLEELVAKRTEELKKKTLHLEESNVALKVLLHQREKDKKEIEENAYLDIIESNLKGIISPFSISLSNNQSKLTPTEVQVADLIRQGKTTKDIAKLLNLSPTTVATHRQKIRKKLTLTNKKMNLQVILQQLNSN